MTMSQYLGLTFVNRCLSFVLLGVLVVPILHAQDRYPSSQQQAPAHSEPVATDSGQTNSGRAAPDHDQKSEHRYELQPGEDPENRLISPFLKHVVRDQEYFWTTPAHLHTKDLKWILPVAGVTAGLIASDSWFSKQIPNKPNQLSRSLSISNDTVYSLVGIGGAAFVLGHIKNNDHMKETGLLAAEAAVNATVATYAFKYATERQRPYTGSGNGSFFQSGGNSFPSEHAAIAWSIASVVAHEYPGPVSRFAAYGLATAVSLTRVTAQQHFPSDVVIGGLLGWYFGHEVYHAHHNPELSGAAWGDVFEDKGETPRNPKNMGSPYVPLDSWIYPAIERLAALGYIQSDYLGMRPWTRFACARMLEDVGEQIANANEDESDDEAAKIYSSLETEFSEEASRLNGAANIGARLESIYSRITNISGTPLNDGYHFGQTIVNDFGRPYGRGFNSDDGITAYAEAGPIAISFRGEYQHAPALASDSAAVLQAIASADGLCLQPLVGPGCAATVPTSELLNGRSVLNRFALLDSSIAVQFNNVEFSFGKQSQWLGPGESGPLLLSTNAAPIPMFKIDSVSPYHLPLFSRLLGPVRTEFFIGQLAGQRWELDAPNLVGPNISPQPFLDGVKISFKPTPNLEIGMGATAMFGGPGLPVTWHNFLQSFYYHSATGFTPPAKRASSADFSYRVPGLRKWLTIYGDTLAVDEISPIGSTRATVNPGIYMPQMPKIPKLELRAEGINEPLTREFAPGFVYYGLRRYHSGYTNEGNLMGSWIGRAGRGGQGWLTYSFSPRTQLQLQYRLQEVSKDFIGGGRSTDYSAHGSILISRDVAVSGFLQYERWAFPILSPARQSDTTASFQLTFYPSWRMRK